VNARQAVERLQRAERTHRDRILDPRVLQVPGYCGEDGRRFLSALCAGGETRYLEIGVHRGATFISALHANDATGCGVDNWSEFGDFEVETRAACERFLPASRYSLCRADCWGLRERFGESFGRYNILFYDGEHSQEAQRRAPGHFASFTDPVFLYLVDDWGWEAVRAGTLQGIAEAGLQVLHQVELGADREGDAAGYWNGLAAFALRQARRR
jgi:hypothetical protein